jgi:hypothetical protein
MSHQIVGTALPSLDIRVLNPGRRSGSDWRLLVVCCLNISSCMQVRIYPKAYGRLLTRPTA